MPYEFELLRARLDGGVLSVTIDNPPINLFDLELMRQMHRLSKEAEADDAVRVIVFESANPDFFIAHADVEMILRLPVAEEPPSELNPFLAMLERFRTMPKVSIAKIEGRCRGGGSEFVLSLDMRFAAMGRAVLSQPEVALGIIPGGSGTQRLPRLMGRARALEVAVGCQDFPAEVAERYGYVNRALPPAELGPFVERLARRIASYPPEAIAAAKASVDNAGEMPLREGLLAEAAHFNRTLGTTEARQRMERFLEAGGQTPEGELDLDTVLDALADGGA